MAATVLAKLIQSTRPVTRLPPLRLLCRLKSPRESVYPTYAERAYHRETCQPKKDWTMLQGILDNGTIAGGLGACALNMAGAEHGNTEADVGEGRMAASEGANGGEYADEGQDGRGDTELFSKSLKIQSKRFYVDVKQNRRGKFIKIAEVSVNRSGKSKVIFTMGVARDFCTKLTSFANFLAQAPKRDEESEESGNLMSESIRGPNNRMYYLDLKENNRGKFLKINQTGTFGRGGRTNIAVPAQGIVDIRNALSEVLEEYGSEEEEVSSDLPASREQRVEQKRFYFDVGSNPRGVYLRISEVTANYRNSITIPKRGWANVRDIIDDFVKKMDDDEEDEEEEEEEEEEEDEEERGD